jgi:hypothetical protein
MITKRTIGGRVGAICGNKDGVIEVFGYGVYEGDHVPPEEAGGFNLGIPNPRIKLDNGDTVYGCECWWGPEEEIKKKLVGHQTRIVRIDDKRNKVDKTPSA